MFSLHYQFIRSMGFTMTIEQARANYIQALQKAHRHHRAIAECDELCEIGSTEATENFKKDKESI